MSKKIVIVGTGAVGGYVGGYMARAGHDVTLVDVWPAHVEKIRTDGLALGGLTEPEDFTVTGINAIHLTELHDFGKGGPFDIAFVSTKSYDTVWATRMIADFLAPGAFVVSLQNSINEERIAGVVGWGRTVGCIASKISVGLMEPGHIQRYVKLGGDEHTVFRVGEPHGRITKRIEEIRDLVGLADSAATTTNLWGERWSKLAVNCMRNPIAAATGRGGNDNDRDEHTRRLALGLAAEAVQVGEAHGFELEKIYGMAPADVVAAVSGDATALERCEAKLMESVATRSDEQLPSMGQDMVKRRRTEIGFINGLVVDKANELGLSAPLNAGIVEVVQRIERGEIEASPAAVAHLRV
jgi:2-dehydropantoate 2-reductase